MEALLTIISSSGASLILVFLLRSWISARLENAIRHEYQVKLEQLRGEMAKEQALSVERFKSQCQKELQDRRIIFERLHEKTAEAKRIFLTEGTAERIDTFIETIFNKAVQFRREVVDRRPNQEEDPWEQIATFMIAEGKELFRALENDFRKALGNGPEDREVAPAG